MADGNDAKSPKRRLLWWLSSAALLCLGLLLPVVTYDLFPENVPIHYSGGHADAWLSKPVGPFLVPVVMTLLYPLWMLLVHAALARKSGSGRPHRLEVVGFGVAVVVTAISVTATLLQLG